MDSPIDPQSQEIIDSLVESGRYASAGDVVRLAVQLVKEREAKLNALRATLDETIADDVWLTDEQIGRHFEDRAERRAKERVRHG